MVVVDVVDVVELVDVVDVVVEVDVLDVLVVTDVDVVAVLVVVLRQSGPDETTLNVAQYVDEVTCSLNNMERDTSFFKRIE